MKLVLGIVLAVLIGGCSRPTPPAATALDAERSHVELAELQEGRALLVRKCSGSCHQVPLPIQHTASEWPQKIGEMAQRSGLDGTQRRLIEQYLVAMAPR